ncbi:SAM-dependent methyltransferase [Microbacterium thalli]|uniref:SAM-dependent methyltransferase n=1 Tax=Microbacterium thalli TaxID=3027921 RepID=UPI002366B512|nr:SAM-dependent methyltransferase [Microbacterium thalli]MDD7929975.1 SAM-dependent methyltransferase [Microbacterium thalli]
MHWPFLYLPGETLSATELAAARLDGDVVEVGEAFIPADAVETAELRAASLRPLLSLGLAVTHLSAAWVHGAVADPPARHTVQRCSARRLHHVIDIRLHYRDRRVPPGDLSLIGGVPVTTPARTLGDLVRSALSGGAEPPAAAVAMMALDPALCERATAALVAAGPVSFKRPALEWLRRHAAQEEVTR